MTVAAFLELVLGVLDGLAAVHAAGIVHRDLKPENIFLVHDPAGDYAKLLDFGISRATEHGRGHTITRDGVIPGTPEYVSPERARGGAQYDPRSDIYSLAVVMYEALAGRRPIQGHNVAELIATLLGSDPVPLEALRPDLPLPLTRCVMKAMARRPEDRHANVEEMREELLSATAALGDAATLRLVSLGASTTSTQPGVHTTLPRTGVWAPQPVRPPEPARALSSLSGMPWIRESTLKRLLVAGVVGLIAVVVPLVYLLSGRLQTPASGGRESPSAIPPHVAAAVPRKQPDATPRPQARPPDKVAIELRGLPDDARITVDGTPVEGPTLDLRRGSGKHRIRVTAPGRKRWTMEHDAERDGYYVVRLRKRKSRKAQEAKKKSRNGRAIMRELDF